MKIKIFLVLLLCIIAFGANEVIAFNDACEENLVIRGYTEKWIYRIKDGKLQRRLWSEQLGKWLTEWEDVK